MLPLAARCGGPSLFSKVGSNPKRKSKNLRKNSKVFPPAFFIFLTSFCLFTIYFKRTFNIKPFRKKAKFLNQSRKIFAKSLLFL